MFTRPELTTLLACARLVDAMRKPPEHPFNAVLPPLLDKLTSEISPTRRDSNADERELKADNDDRDRIGTAAAAKLLNCTQRRVQQKIESGELQAEKVSGRYILNRKDIAA